MPDSDILDIDSRCMTDAEITKIEYHSYVTYTNPFKNKNEIMDIGTAVGYILKSP